MRAVPRARYRGDGSGVVWPDTGTDARNDVRDGFGPRPFSPHIPTVGYDYDLHRGLDVVLDIGDPIYSSISGTVTRMVWSHFGFQTDAHLDQWEEVDPGAIMSLARAGSILTVTGDRSGTSPWGAGAAYYRALSAGTRISAAAAFTVEMMYQITGATGSGAFGMGMYDEGNGEWYLLDVSSAGVSIRGRDSGGDRAENGTSDATPGVNCVRIDFDGADLRVYVSTDSGDTFTQFGAAYNPSWSDTRKVFRPVIYWAPADVDASPAVLEVDDFNLVDDSGLGRAGNWCQVVDGTRKVVNNHLREVDVVPGQVVKAGDVLGTAGLTGFDARSGRIVAPHVHVELLEHTDYFYDNELPKNPLVAGFYPRVDVTNNVTVAVDTGDTDPDSVASISLDITVSREDQDLDVNEVTLVGSLATRTINFDTRAGLNADVDVPLHDGVYIVAFDFDEFDSAYRFKVHFHQSVVGSLTSWEVRDSAGVLLESG